MMKVIPSNPDTDTEEISPRSPQRMGGRFYVKPYQVHDKLKKLGASFNEFYDDILRNAVIKENWETNSVWVLGTFMAAPKQLRVWTGKSYSYVRILIRKLTKAKLIMQGANGSYTLPMYKKKQDEGIRPSDIHAINDKLEQLEEQNAALQTLVRDFMAHAEANGKMPLPVHSGKPQKEKKEENGSLSGDKIISIFYKGIGQERIAGEKREKARGVYRKLRADKFTPEEICFAVQWTLENANAEPYDFALIQATIGQALATRKKEVERKEAEEDIEKEVDRRREEIEKEESERDDLEFYKADLSPEERAELREEATKELRDIGAYPEQFITDILLGIKENEILRRRLPDGAAAALQVTDESH